MWKNKIWTLLAKISITMAFLLMLIFGFVELVKTNFVFYDAVVVKLNFWNGNLAQALWNLLSIIAFFVFVFGTIWKIKHRVLVWLFGIIYVLIGNLTLIFIIIDFINGKIEGVKLTIGIIISFLLILGAIFLLFIASGVNQRFGIKKNKKRNPKIQKQATVENKDDSVKINPIKKDEPTENE